MYVLENTLLLTDLTRGQALLHDMNSWTEQIYEAAMRRTQVNFNWGLCTGRSASDTDSAIPIWASKHPPVPMRSILQTPSAQMTPPVLVAKSAHQSQCDHLGMWRSSSKPLIVWNPPSPPFFYKKVTAMVTVCLNVRPAEKATTLAIMAHCIGENWRSPQMFPHSKASRQHRCPEHLQKAARFLHINGLLVNSVPRGEPHVGNALITLICR